MESPTRPEAHHTEGIPEYVMSLFHKDFVGICVDIGAENPMWDNNSWIFEQKGWEAFCIEANPAAIPLLQKHRRHVIHCACSDHNAEEQDLFVYRVPELGEASGTSLQLDEDAANWFSHAVKVRVRTLDWLMQNEILRHKIDYLSIDVERHEMAVLAGASLLQWNPKVISIENFLDETPAQAQQRERLGFLGYTCIHRVAHDDIYIKAIT